MITTTLTDLPGRRAYDVLGVVIGVARVSPGSNAEEAARRQLEAQAEGMGADAIIDVHLQMKAVPGGGPGRQTELAIALIGTAIKFIPPRAHTP